MRLLRLFSALLLATAALAAPLAAQTSRVTVRVVEANNASPLPGMGVVLRGTSLQGVTGPDGTVVFPQVPRGTYTLELRDGSGKAHENQVAVRRPEVEVTLRVRPGTTALEPLVVTARTEQQRVTRAMATRRDLFDREFIEQNRAGKRHVGDLLMGQVPGLLVREAYLPGERGEPSTTRLCIESNRRHRPIQTPSQQAGRGLPELGSRIRCSMMEVYLDGMRISDPGTALLGLSLDAIESVEVLTPQQAVIRYGTIAAYGVLEIYTRGSGPHARRTGR